MALFKKSGFDFEEYYKEQEREEKKRQDSLNNVMKKRRGTDNSYTLSQSSATNAAETNLQFADGQLYYKEQVKATFKQKYNYGFKMAVLAPLPFMIFWCFIDISVLIGVLSSVIAAGAPAYILGFVIPFIAVHMTPVWIWIYSMVKAKKAQQYTYFVVTDQRIISTKQHYKTGKLGLDSSIKITEVTAMAVSQTEKEKQRQVGDIYVFGKKSLVQLKHLENPEEVLSQIQNLVGSGKNNIEYIYDTNVDLQPYIEKSKYYYLSKYMDGTKDYEDDDDIDDEEEWDDSPEALLAKDQEELENGDWEIDEDDEIDYENDNWDEAADRLINNPNLTEENRKLLIEQKQRSAQMRAKLKEIDEKIATNKQNLNKAKKELQDNENLSMVDRYADVSRRADDAIKRAKELKKQMKDRRDNL